MRIAPADFVCVTRPAIFISVRTVLMQLNYWKASWPLLVDICPCDMHFVEYLQAEAVQDKVIFHFGTGAHHILGKMNLEAAVPNEILAITASREEYDSYIEFIIAHPLAAKTYT